jgi:hypothetical protein
MVDEMLNFKLDKGAIKVKDGQRNFGSFQRLHALNRITFNEKRKVIREYLAIRQP